MALDDMFQDGIDTAVNNRAQLTPETAPEVKGWLGPTLSAPFRGIGAGLTEVGAFASEVASAFGDVQSAYDYSGRMPAGMESYGEFQKEEARAAQDRLVSGESWSNPAADELRATARWMGPNPQTAGAAEQTLFQLSRVITKAVGYSVVGGLPAGAAATGFDEGMTASDELRREGVDFNTRAKIGALTGVTTAASVALPVAGRTLAQTGAIVAASGPVLFIGQNMLSRDILQSANYDHLADRYDPFDPVGLAVSTLLPAAFGGWALRGRARAARAGEAPRVDGAPEADGVAPEVRNQPGDSDLVDAARVQRSREIVESWNLGRPEDIRAANDALVAVMRASDQLASGVPVNVADRIPMQQAYAARAIERMIEKSEAVRTDLVADASRLAEPGAITAMRAEIRDLQATRQGVTTEEGIRAIAKEIQTARTRTSYKQALAEARQIAEQRAGDTDATIARLEQQIDDNAAAVQSRQALDVLDRQIEQMRADRASIDAPATDLTPVAAALRDVTDQAPARGRSTGRAQADQTAGQPDVPAAPVNGAGAPQAGAIPDAAPFARPAPMMDAPMASEAMIAGRLAEIQATNPDAPVRLEGMDNDIPLSEALTRLQAEADQGIADSALLRIAANCAIGA